MVGWLAYAVIMIDPLAVTASWLALFNPAFMHWLLVCVRRAAARSACCSRAMPFVRIRRGSARSGPVRRAPSRQGGFDESDLPQPDAERTPSRYYDTARDAFLVSKTSQRLAAAPAGEDRTLPSP
jgi:hypothetical protein